MEPEHLLGPRAGDAVTLVDVLDRILDRGIVLDGEVRITLADIDLLWLGVRLMVTSADHAQALRDQARAEADAAAAARHATSPKRDLTALEPAHG